MNQLVVKDLTKRYGQIDVLDHVSYELVPGIYGLLGPNGAGKSTMMNLLTDNLRKSSGDILWNGTSIQALGKEYRKILGYAPQQQGIYESFTGKRFLKYLGTLKGISKAELKDEVERVGEVVNLSDKLNLKLNAYSGGMKQRILLAQALMGDPKFLILDEPTQGLDPKERVRLREQLSGLGEEKIILLATHIVSDIETIAKEILVLKGGVLIAKGKQEDLIRTYAPEGKLEDVYMELFGTVGIEGEEEVV